MMKIYYKLYTLVFLVFSSLLLAEIPPAPTGVPEGGGGGGTGTGAPPENPIDMYLIWLGVLALVTIFYFVKKQKKQLV